MDRACLKASQASHAGTPVCGSAGVFLKSELREKQNKPCKQEKEGLCEKQPSRRQRHLTS